MPSPTAYDDTRPRAREKARRNAMVASAVRVRLDDQRAAEAARRRRSAWQTEAWSYFHAVGEVGFSCRFLGDAISKLRLFVATRPDPEQPPIPADDPDSGVDLAAAQIAIDALARLKGDQGGQAQLLRELEINLEVAAELYLHGTPPRDEVIGPDGEVLVAAAEESWEVHSINELVVEGGRWTVRDTPGVTGEPVGDNDLVIRLWMRDPEYGGLAHCAMQGVLSECESLQILSREIRAAGRSRLFNGLLLMPSELSFGAADTTHDLGDGEATKDPFDQELEQGMLTPIQDEGSAVAVVPITVRGPAEYLKEIRHLALGRDDSSTDAKIEARLVRIANGLNLPLEVVLSHRQTSYANAASIDEATFDDFIQPRATTIVDLLTYGYLTPTITSPPEGQNLPTVDAEQARKMFVWYDATDLVAHPGREDEASKAHSEGVLSDEARRRYAGFTEADAPDDMERLRRFVLGGHIRDPNVQAQLLIITGLAPGIEVPAPSAGVAPSPPVEAQPVEAQAALVPVSLVARPAAAFVAHQRDGRWWGQRLAGIDRELRTKIRVAADRALQRCLERAGAKLRSRAGTSFAAILDGVANHLVAATLGPAVASRFAADLDLVQGAFVDLTAQVEQWMTLAQADAVVALGRWMGGLDAPTMAALLSSQGLSLTQALTTLNGRLESLAANRLYDPTPGLPPAGEIDASLSVPEWIIREAVGIAGGARPIGGEDGTPLTDGNGGPVMGVATGPDAMTAASDAAGGDPIEGYEWVYGDATRRAFQPHEDLNGVTVENVDDPAWANETGWPMDQCLPGDHDGCFLAGTVVSGVGATAATARWYEGPLVELTFASGEFLTCTPNHPILTGRGFVAAGLLVEGDDVIGCRDAERVAGLVDPDHHQRPALIEQVFSALDVGDPTPALHVPTSAVDFHGDGEGSQVHVVRVDLLLRDRLESALRQPEAEATLVRRLREQASLTDTGRRDAAGERVRATSFSGVGIGDELVPVLDAHGAVAQQVRLGNPSPGHTGLDEPFADRAPIDAVAGSQVLLRGGGVLLDEHGDIRESSHAPLPSGDGIGLFSTAPDSSLLEYAAQHDWSDVEPLGGPVATVAGEIRIDRVAKTVRRSGAAHVYNLDTGVGWFIAGTVIVGNCLCDISPVLITPGESSGDEPSSDTGAEAASAAPALPVPRTDGAALSDSTICTEEDQP